MSKPTKIILDKQSDLILTNAKIVGATGIVKSDLPGLVNDLSSLNSAIQTEASDRSTEIAVERARINAILDGSDINLDQFREVVAFVQSIDMTNDADLLAKVAEINGKITAEEVARIAADAQLTSDLADLQSYVDTTVDSAISQLTSDLADETADRIADVDAEEARATAAESALQAAIDAETSARIAADETIDGKIADIISNTDLTSIDSFTEVVDNLNAEIAARIVDVDAEEARALAAESALQAAIDAETAARIAGDETIDGKIADIISNTDLTSIDSFTEVVTNLDTEIAARIADVDAEETRALAAESALQAAIDTETSARISGDDNLQSNLDSAIAQEVSDRTAAIEAANADLTNETSLRISGDANLQSEIDALALTDGDTIDVDQVQNVIRLKEVVSAPASGVRTFEGDIKVGAQPDTQGSYNDLSLVTKGIMDTRLQEEVGSINDSISGEIARAQAKESELETSIETEKARIDAILDASEADKDSFKEIVDLINSVDTTNDEAFAGYVLSNNERLTNEEQERLRLTNLLGDGLVNEQIAREDGDAFIQHEIDVLPTTDGETIEVNPVDNTIRLKEVVDAPDSGYRTFRGDVKAEEQPATLPSFNDLSLVTKLYVDEKVGNDLTDAINAEEDARTQADAALQSLLDNEVAERIADVDAEEARATAAEAALDATKLNLAGGTMTGDIEMNGNDINNIEAVRTNAVFLNALEAINGDFVVSWSNINMRDENMITGLRQPLDSGDATNKTYVDTTVNTAIDNLTSDLADETSRAIAAEGVLQSNIDVEKSRIDAILDGSTVDLDQFAEVVSFVQSIDMTNDEALLTAVTNINTEVAAEVAARIADVDAEEVRAIAAETALSATFSAAMTAEVLRATTKEDYLEAALSGEINGRVEGDAALSATFSAAMTAEVAARIAGDAQLTSDLADLQSYVDTTVDSAISQLTSDLANETAARIADVDAEETRALAAEGVLQSNINTEANERVAEDITLQGNIDIESTRAQSAETAIAADLGTETAARIAAVSAEQARATAAEGVLTSDLSAEVSRATASEGVLQSNINVEKGRIDAILIGASASADNFAEIVALINSVDTENDQVFAGYVLSNDAALAAEVSRAESAEDVLTSDLSTESARAIAAEGVLTSNLATEVSRAQSAESTLTSALSAEESSRIAGDSALQSSLNNEISDRIAAGQSAQTALDNESARAIAAEGVLTSGLADEISNRVSAVSTEEASRIAGDAQLSSDLSSEIANRIADVDAEQARATAAEGVLTSDLATEVADRVFAVSSEESARIAGDAQLSSDLSALSATFSASMAAEVSRATAAEGVLQSNIDVEKGRIDAILIGASASADNFAEIVSLINSVDTTNDQVFAGYVLSNDAALAAEVLRAQSSESALSATFSASMAAEVSRATAAEVKLTSDLSSEVSRATAAEAQLFATFSAAIASEFARATSVESAMTATFSASMAAEVSRATSAEAQLTSDLASEVSRATSAEAQLFATFSSAIASEFSRATAAEASLSSDISSLQSYVDTTVDSAISTLTSDLASEETRAIAAEGVLQSNINTEANERVAEDITLQGNIDIEATRAQSAETAIAADLGTETAARIAGDAQLSSDLSSLSATFSYALSAEVSRATAAEGVLQSNIDVEKGRIDAILIGASASADNFAEIVTLINSVDTTNDQVFAGYVLSNDAALAAEVSRATASEATLTSDLSSEVLRATAAEGVLTSNLATEVSRATAAEGVLTSALSAEESSRIAGDASLQASLNNEIADRVAAGQSAQSALDNESARAIAAEGVLTAAIDAEVSRSTAAEAALSATFSSALSAESARATAAELVLTTDFANIYCKKVAVSGTPNGVLTTFTLALPVRVGSEMIYVNGLLMEEGEDYTTVVTSGKVSGVEFLYAPSTEMKVRAYGVCGI
jgi:hypothetical protein